jgi:hypothetical protein
MVGGQIVSLKEELRTTKERLRMCEAGLVKLAGASDSCPTDDIDTARLAELLAAEMKADKANAKVSRRPSSLSRTESGRVPAPDGC